MITTGREVGAVARVLLIDLGTDRDEINEPIGIGALSSYATKMLPDRITIEQRLYPIHLLPSVEDLTKVDIVGLSTRLRSLDRLHTIVDRTRIITGDKRPLMVLGDLIATFATGELLAEVPEAICVVGEGEEALVGIIEAWLSAGRSRDDLLTWLLERQVPNLVFNHTGCRRATGRSLLDLATAPKPDRGLVREVASRGGIIRAEGSRGCSWGRCNFCAVQYKYCEAIAWRPIPVSRIVEELEELSGLRVRSPFFTDEDFVGDSPTRAIEVAHALAAARRSGRISTDVTLYMDARVDTVLAPSQRGKPSGADVFRALRQAGLREVFLGVESGAKEQVRRYRKAATGKRNLNAIKALTNLGLTLDIGFIMFDPEMDIEELVANMDFIEQAGLKNHDARLTKSIRVEPGTHMATEYKAKGLISGPLDVDDLTFPYRWADSRVEAVHEAFSRWEDPYLDQLYELQGTTRGEVPNEGLRAARRVHLGKLRSVDLDVLRYLVNVADSNGDPMMDSLDEFRRKRDQLLAI